MNNIISRRQQIWTTSLINTPSANILARGAPQRAIKEEMGRAGRNVLLAYGGGSLKRTGLYDRLRGWLHECGKHVVDFGGIRPNPTYAKVQEGARLVREQGIDFILAVGGGSVIDCCKIVSAQARTDEDIWDMMYEAHRLPTGFVPTGAVVTASGTGAEQNNGAVITHTAKRLKQPLVGAYHSFAILDSDLTKTLPMKQVVSGAFDTLSHCMETYMGRPQGDNLSDEINEAVMRSVIKNLRALIANPDDDFARGELMWDSALAENGLPELGRQTDFQCHMLEHAVGAYTDCNHGQGLAVIHPALYRHLLAEGKALRTCVKTILICSPSFPVILSAGLPFPPAVSQTQDGFLQKTGRKPTACKGKFVSLQAVCRHTPQASGAQTPHIKHI